MTTDEILQSEKQRRLGRLSGRHVILDTVDIDRNGHCVVTGVCCVECREKVRARFAAAGRYEVEIHCEECFSQFAKWAE